MIPGLPPPQSTLAIVTSGGIKKQKQSSQRINNIGMGNVVILKWLVVKEAGNDFKHYHKYSIAALTRSYKLAPTKFAGPKVLQPILQVTTSVTKIVEKSFVKKHLRI